MTKRRAWTGRQKLYLSAAGVVGFFVCLVCVCAALVAPRRPEPEEAAGATVEVTASPGLGVTATARSTLTRTPTRARPEPTETPTEAELMVEELLAETPAPPATPTPTETPTATLLPPTNTPLLPTATPLPPTNTPAPAPAGPRVVVAAVNKEAEYVDIQNTGGEPQDLGGWRLFSERGAQDCPLAGVIQPGETLRVWAMAEDAGQGGFNCGYETNIWNNSEPDTAILFDGVGGEVDRR